VRAPKPETGKEIWKYDLAEVDNPTDAIAPWIASPPASRSLHNDQGPSPTPLNFYAYRQQIWRVIRVRSYNS